LSASFGWRSEGVLYLSWTREIMQLVVKHALNVLDGDLLRHFGHTIFGGSGKKHTSFVHSRSEAARKQMNGLVRRPSGFSCGQCLVALFPQIFGDNRLNWVKTILIQVWE